jgi:SAM-dependent methyltransferase
MVTNTSDRNPADPLRLLAHLPRSAARVLDCACGDGARGAALKARAACFVAGIESDASLAGTARGILDDVVHGDQYSCALPWDAESFDCAVCEGLLPKLRDPAPFLARVFSIMRPGGLFAASAPNIQYYEHFLMLARGRWQYASQGALAREHIRFFTAYGLVALLQRAGFTSVRCGILDTAAPAAFPLDETGHVRLEDLVVGPMNTDQHKAFLAREYVVLGAKPG